MFKFLSLTALLFGASLVMAQGRCQKGNCHTGAGMLRFADGAFYSGNFERGEFNGPGTLTFPDGAVYTGNFRNQQQHGRGKLVDSAGKTYIGTWRNGKRHGRGELTYPDGGQLEGEWVADELQGEVTFTFANQDRYVGRMADGMLSGFGKMEYVNGDSYTGQWKDNQPHGSGQMTYAGGTQLRTEWSAGQPQVDWQNLGYTGEPYELADCNEGCPDGPGRFTYADGTVYTGQLINGSPYGTGTVTFTDGRRYEGGILDHRPHGLGVMQQSDGTLSGGIWEDGTLVRRLYSDQRAIPANQAVAYDPEVKVWAVVVGVAYYQHMQTLRYTDDDAYQFYAFLKSIEGGALPDEQLKVLIDEDATHENIVRAMADTYRQADENDLIMFYFSGHGLPGSFLPVDYDGALNALGHDDVHDALLGSRSRHKLVIADACYSGSLAAKSGGSNSSTLSAYYSALLDAQASTALMMSSNSEEISMEDGGLRSGVFSHYLIRGLKGEADASQDGLVTIEELFAYVHREVRGYTGNLQTPTLTGTYDTRMPIASVRRR